MKATNDQRTNKIKEIRILFSMKPFSYGMQCNANDALHRSIKSALEIKRIK